MFSKLKEAANGARLRAGQMWRERKERAEERKQATEPPGVTIPLSLVRSAKLASWMAYFCLVYFLWLYTLDIARDRAGELHLTHVGSWVGEFLFFFPYIIGFAMVAVGIPYVAKISLPTFMSLSWHDNAWAKGWALFIVLCVSSVIIAGTFTVQGDTIMERDRESAVAVEQVQQSRAALEAQIESRRQELADMMNNRNAYLAQAASVGAAEWQRSYIDQTPASDPQRDRIVRALGAARSADTLRAEIADLRQQLAASTTTAAVQGEVVTERTGWIADALGWLEGVRAILLSLVMDIVCLVMPWIALRLEQARNRQLGLAEGIPRHRFMLNDLTENAPPASVPSPLSREEFEKRKAPMDSGYQGDTIYDERGNELVWVEGFVRPKDGKWIPGHYRKSGKRKKQEIEVEIGGKMFTTSGIDHETGVDHDGGARIASVPPRRDATSADHVAASALNVPSPELAISEPIADSVQAPSEEGAESQRADNGGSNNELHPEPSTDPAPLETLSEEELDVLLALESAATIDPNEVPQRAEGDDIEGELGPEGALDTQQVEGSEQEGDADVNERSLERGDDQIADQNDTPITDERRMLAANVAAE